VRKHFEKIYGKEAVTSGTVLGERAPGARYAQSRHPTSGVVYDQRCSPIFDDVAKFDTRLQKEQYEMSSSKSHMKAAALQLKIAIEKGQINPNTFTADQLGAIKSGNYKVPGYTWHHHQDVGRMQLISEQIHKNAKPQTGGAKVWKGGDQ
jgi:hypothetical protein